MRKLISVIRDQTLSALLYKTENILNGMHLNLAKVYCYWLTILNLPFVSYRYINCVDHFLFLGSYCVSRNCSRKRLEFYGGYPSLPKNYPKFQESCSCSTGTPVCSDRCCNHPPPSAHADTGDTVWNITTRNFNDYLLRTDKQFRKKR